MAEADKVILNQYYTAQPTHAYFTGCSQGGHEAMIEAQRYPNDFDGIRRQPPNGANARPVTCSEQRNAS